MATDLESIKNTLVNISKGNSILDMLIEFERTMDNAEVFAYKNWILGEIVEGPDISRYWVKIVLMYPYAMMPDPEAGLRLTKLGAKVGFKKSIFKKPVKVKGPSDWIDAQSKKAKIADHEVWLVTIEMPIKYINRGIENAETIIQADIDASTDELADAYDNGMPDEEAMPEDMSMPDATQDPAQDLEAGL